MGNKLGAVALVGVLLCLGVWLLHSAHERGSGPDAQAPAPGTPTARPSATHAEEAEAPAVAENGSAEVQRAAVDGAPKSTTGSLLVHVLWGDDKSPATAVTITLYRSGVDALFDEPEALTDEHGDARFLELAPGKLYVQTRRGEGNWSDEVAIIASEETRTTFTIELGINCKGKVVDGQARPIADAEVLVAGWAGGEAWPLARTGADGSFALRCIATHCHVGARKAGYAPSLLRQFTGAKGAGVELQIVLADPAALLSGVVLDPQHQPLAGAVVEAGAEKNGMEKLPDGGIAKAPMPERVRSDAQGRFAFQSLVPGGMPVAVRARGLAPWRGTAELQAGRETKLTVQLEAGVTLIGTISDSSGARVPKATLTIGEYGDLGQRSARSDEEGAYRIEGSVTGEFTVHAERDGKGTAETTLQAVAGQTLRWDPVLSNGLVLKGRMLDADEKPVAQAWVQGQLEQPDKDDRWWGNSGTDKEGRFQFENCAAGKSIRIQVNRKSTFPELTVAHVVPGSEELVLHLPKEAWIYIQGRIVDPDDKSLSNVHVSPFMKGGNGSPAETADPTTGAFHYGPYPPGEYQLTLQADGYPRIVLPWRTLAADEVWDVGTLHFQKGGSLLVNVSRADGVALPGHLWLQVLDASGEYLEQMDVQDGIGRAGPFAPGTCLLQIQGSGLAARQQALVIQPGVEMRVDVQVSAGIPVELECTSAQALDPNSGVRIVIRDAAGASVMSGLAWSREGAPKLSLALLPGAYRVEATQGALHGSAVLTVAQGADANKSVVTLGP